MKKLKNLKKSVVLKKTEVSVFINEKYVVHLPKH